MIFLSDRDRYIDLKEGLARVRDNKKLFGRMLGMFISSGELVALEESFAQSNQAKAGEVVHAIKGAAGNLSLKEIFNLSVMMMDEIRHGKMSRESLDEMKFAYEETNKHIKEVIAELAS